LEELKKVIPEAFTEGKIDAEKFFAALGDDIDSRPERYSFSWAGKKDAIRILQTTSRGTLKPAKDESVNWNETQNLFIEGDNLEVLKLLYKSYFGQVKMIYIDPPYNTGNDFVYYDDYSDPLDTYLKVTGQKDENGNRRSSNSETNGRYHSAWLSMMYPRLFVARQLLQEDGVIFVSIDDKEVFNLRLIMNEIFGEENFVSQLVWKSRQIVDSRPQSGVSSDHEYVLVYGKTQNVRIRGKEIDKSKYSNPDDDPRGSWMSNSILGLATKSQRPNLHYDIKDPKTGISFSCPQETGWRYSKETMQEKISDGRIVFPAKPEGRPREKKFLSELANDYTGFSSVLHQDVGFTLHGTRELRDILEENLFPFPKPVSLIHALIEQGADEPDSIVMDFFSGSCTTAHAVLKLNHAYGGNRRFIMVQLPEPTELEDFPTIADIGKERIRRVIKKLQDETNGQLDLKDRDTPEDLGFKVFKLSSSNYQLWENVDGETDPDVYKDLLQGQDDPLVNGWKEEDVLYEIALKEGYSLNAVIEKEKVGSLTVYRIDDPEREQTFQVCLEKKLTLDALKPLNLKKDDLFICRNIALDDTIAANLALQCRLMVI
jgi:adenine-specific DNA-methyltransferase